MNYFMSFARFIGAVEDEGADHELDLPPTADETMHHAIQEGQDPFSDMQEYLQEKNKSHRLQMFGREMAIFYKDRAHVNEIDAIEARLAAMDAAEDTTWRMDKVNDIKQRMMEAEQRAWDKDFDTKARRY